MRAWIPLAIATLAAIVMGVAPGLALACSPSEPGIFVPHFDERPVPQNFRFFRWRDEDERDDGYELRDDAGQLVQLRRERLGGRVDTFPVTPAAPGRYRFQREGLTESMPVVVRRGLDTLRPTLRAVGRPRAVHWPSRGMCGGTDDTTLAIDASDDSPLFVAVWGADSGEPDLTEKPVLYTQIHRGAIQLWHARQALDIEPGKGSWAVMAIDAAGNVSDVVSTPSGRRVPGVVFAATPAEVSPSRAALDVSVPHVDQIEDEPPPAPRIPSSPRPRGCGCAVPGGSASTGWLLPLGTLLLFARRRRPVGRCPG